ncbi:MAG TPA: PIG-L family deacetylase [Blastocatellia bacterium]|nr:PIG-L family deacetylase [Blastocatellia bacterium]
MRPVLALIALACLSLAPASGSGARAIRLPPRYLPSGVEDRGITALDQVLRELTNPYSVMCVAGSCDDVDWGTLAYYHKRLGARVILVLATRSGEKLEGADADTEADRVVVATRRALAAAHIVGADVHFLDFRDSGDSKSDDDLLKQWGHDQALGRMLRAFRLLRPDVVIANHSASYEQPRHEAVWRLAIEAFEAAADAKRFPEADSRVWQVRRVFQTSDETNADVEVNLAEYDLTRGISYAQIAVEALQSRRPAPPNREPSRRFYKLARSATGERLKPGGSLLAGLQLPENVGRSIAPPGAAGVPLLNAINQRDQLVEALSEKLLEKRVEGSLDDLYQRYGVEFARVLRFRELLERGIALALGLDFRIAISDDLLVPGQKLNVRLVLSPGSNGALPVVFRTPASLADAKNNTPSTASETVAVPRAGAVSRDFEYEVQQDASLTLPHSAHLSERDYYPLGSGLPGAQSTNPFGNEIFVYAEVGIGQTFIILPAMVRFDVSSPIEMSVTPSFALIRDWADPREATFVARVRNRTPGRLAGALWVVPLAITADSYEPAHIEFTREDEEVEVKLRLKLPILKPPLAPDVLIEFRREKPAPPNPLASLKIAVVEAGFEVTSGTAVGFIRGSNAEMLIALSQLGVDIGEVSLDEVRVQNHGDAADAAYPGCAELSRFDSIVIDNFAYSVRRDLASLNRCLLDYVRRGGNLVVLGQTADDWNAQPGQLGLAPFPIKLSRAGSPQPMKILARDHVLMSKPNRMDEKDFENWIVKDCPREWANEYTSLLGPADSSEAHQRSALLVARFGEGSYIYVSFDLRDQLRARNPKAYKFLANLIAAKRPRKVWYDDWQ